VTDPRATIPFDQLPDGIARSLQSPPETPAPAYPSATLVLMRAAWPSLEVLLLRRVKTAGFVPGAFVFPGGRVEAYDSHPDIVERIDGVTAESAARRLELTPDADPPALAYYVAALRETFEETGILVGREPTGGAAICNPTEPGYNTLVGDLRADGRRFPAVLDRRGWRLDGAAMEYIAHWITPVAEPRRFDTRFFAAAVPGGQGTLLHSSEVTEAVWLTPAEALELNVRGDMPMVFPTIRTLESLLSFRAPEDVLEEFAGRALPTILPRLVTTPRGVAMEL
jgi:8-oxo-dGTP pyrophosphatase MutT (NUDIX family)